MPILTFLMEMKESYYNLHFKMCNPLTAGPDYVRFFTFNTSPLNTIF